MSVFIGRLYCVQTYSQAHESDHKVVRVLFLDLSAMKFSNLLMELNSLTLYLRITFSFLRSYHLPRIEKQKYTTK